MSRIALEFNEVTTDKIHYFILFATNNGTTQVQSVQRETHLVTLVAHLSRLAWLSYFTLDFIALHIDITTLPFHSDQNTTTDKSAYFIMGACHMIHIQNSVISFKTNFDLEANQMILTKKIKKSFWIK